jgi:hypothetical protein
MQHWWNADSKKGEEEDAEEKNEGEISLAILC